MKRWYCPNCGVFKRTKKTICGFMGYPDTYHCRCCGTELIDARNELKARDEQYIASLVKSRKEQTNNENN